MPARRPKEPHEQQSPARSREAGRRHEPAIETATRPSHAVRLTRYGLPVAILLAGVIIAIVTPGETGLDAMVGLTGVCACVVLLNLLLRLGASGDRDRVREEIAREHYDNHGRWPDEHRPGK